MTAEFQRGFSCGMLVETCSFGNLRAGVKKLAGNSERRKHRAAIGQDGEQNFRRNIPDQSVLSEGAAAGFVIAYQIMNWFVCFPMR